MRERCLHRSISFGLITLLIASVATAATDGEDVHPNSAMRFASIDYQRDANSNNDELATVSLTLGDYWWVQVNGGKSRSQQQTASSSSVITSMRSGAGVGVAGDHWTAILDFASRRDAPVYIQREWNMSLEWSGVRAALALDASNRKSDNSVVGHLIGPNGGTLDIPLRDIAQGNGVGLHGHFNITEEFSVLAGGMKYHYSSEAKQNGSVVVNGNIGGAINTLVTNYLNNRPALAQRLLTRASAISRDELVLDSSYDLGMSYQLPHVGLTLQYINDKPADSSDNAITTQLSAAILFGQHWTLTPMLGQTKTQQFGNIGFGALSVTYGW